MSWGIQLRTELVGRQCVLGSLKAVLTVIVRLAGFRVDRGSELRRAESGPNRDCRRERVREIDILGVFQRLAVDTPQTNGCRLRCGLRRGGRRTCAVAAREKYRYNSDSHKQAPGCLLVFLCLTVFFTEAHVA